MTCTHAHTHRPACMAQPFDSSQRTPRNGLHLGSCNLVARARLRKLVQCQPLVGPRRECGTQRVTAVAAAAVHAPYSTPSSRMHKRASQPGLHIVGAAARRLCLCCCCVHHVQPECPWAASAHVAKALAPGLMPSTRSRNATGCKLPIAAGRSSRRCAIMHASSASSSPATGWCEQAHASPRFCCSACKN